MPATAVPEERTAGCSVQAATISQHSHRGCVGPAHMCEVSYFTVAPPAARGARLSRDVGFSHMLFVILSFFPLVLQRFREESG